MNSSPTKYNKSNSHRQTTESQTVKSWSGGIHTAAHLRAERAGPPEEVGRGKENSAPSPSDQRSGPRGSQRGGRGGPRRETVALRALSASGKLPHRGLRGATGLPSTSEQPRERIKRGKREASHVRDPEGKRESSPLPATRSLQLDQI